MPRGTKSQTGRARRLYHSAKISPYQFKRVLWYFAIDATVAEAASHIDLSANSISALYTKLRKFFFDYALFRDPYHGRDPREGFEMEGFKDIELLILLYHMRRFARKRGKLASPMVGPDYHFAESNWRFDYYALRVERGPAFVQRMMYGHLLEFVKRFGPVGSPREPTQAQREAGRDLAIDQINRVTLWLERNSPRFKSAEERNALRSLREEL